MGKIFQLRAKQRINSKLDKGFVLTVPSTSSTKPRAQEIVAAVESQFGKEATRGASFESYWEIIS